VVGAGLIECSAVPPLEIAWISPFASAAISSALLTAVTSRECLWDGRTGWGATVVTAASSGALGGGCAAGLEEATGWFQTG
jgi:hypothetical protein